MRLLTGKTVIEQRAVESRASPPKTTWGGSPLGMKSLSVKTDNRFDALAD